ncbi:MAG: NAD-dependent epimerase/dehydratase family protein [Bryobacterales bacterium]|nr:NAD-dependent epimerase/dehydratase family protein [Bryobacteraceae bacterium]MDW8353045.1 NAD-dependent epimerase/dehydratase family protein [Bryobacterales bacterium]
MSALPPGLRLETPIVGFHNIFGPYGTSEGGREKAPTALCCKIAVAKLTGNPELEIRGGGEQTRAFCYIDDCVEGLHRLIRSDFAGPVNLGQDRRVTISQLADLIAQISGISILKRHVPAPVGVQDRNSDNTLLRRVLKEPQIASEQGLVRTYRGSSPKCAEG